MALRIFFFFILICHFSCSYTTNKNITSNENFMIDEIFALMQGSYSSAEQAALDTNYYNISLHMYPIWENDENSKWLYVEQALYSKQEKPYRIRIYELKMKGNSKVESKVYKLNNQEAFIGKWADTAYFDQYDQSILEERIGCAVYLEKQSVGVFVGSTDDKSCGSTLRGASYATSKVKVQNNRIESWDQGFDSEGKQVWGAIEGAYVFIKE